ncbi:amidase [Pseudomonas putida]|uniref:Amidase n=1 Tax=Pseudomonas putida TaxID=303 RepID=A0A1Q9QWJ3_PSEPU|nr:amidase [Pseudomonas putida]OLS59412.1 hypothetical protein PSEMO_59220 [Pseudomonas putida]
MKRLLLLVLLGLLAWGWSERAALSAFPGILSAYSAKEFCSCRYVMGFDAAYCTTYVKQWLPLSDLRDDPMAHRVDARGLGRSASAQWQGPREGCRLLP